MDPISFLETIPAIGPFIPYILSAGAVCAAVATVLPAPNAGGSKVYSALYAVVNWVGLNVGKAKNAAATPPQA